MHSKNLEENRRCWCPCDCGCEEPHFAVADSGLCPDCEEGNHEVPPQLSDIEKTIPLLESMLVQYKQRKKDLEE